MFVYKSVPLYLRVADALDRTPHEQVPDVTDRVIAAAAQALDLAFVTRDGKIRATGIQAVW